MLIEIILFIIIGTFLGTFTGLVPGIHANLVSSLLVALSASLFVSINPLNIIVLISSLAVAHTFVSFIPSVFLGCPDTDTELSVLPGHELLKKGQGYEAVALTAYGGLASLFLLILIVPLSFLTLHFIQEILMKKIFFPPISIMASTLLLISFYLISIEKDKKNALVVFLLTGILGLAVLGGSLEILAPIKIEIKEPLLPLLTGLFGASTLVLSIKSKTKIPRQKLTKPKIKKDFLKPIFGALIASPLTGLLPGLGSGQAAIIGSTISKTDNKNFLILLGATNTLVMNFSFITLYLIFRTRTGAAAAIESIAGKFSTQILFLILISIFLAGTFSFFITLKLGKFFSKKISKINYTKISWASLILLVIVVALFSKIYGLAILALATLTGIYCISLKVKRTQMMGCILIPTIMFYLFS